MGKQFTGAGFFTGLLGCGGRGGARAKNRFWQNVLLVLFCLGGAATAQAAIPASECEVLTNLYASINADVWQGDILSAHPARRKS